MIYTLEKSLLQPPRLECHIPDTALLVPSINFISLIKKNNTISFKKLPFLPMVNYGVYDREVVVCGPFLSSPMAVMLIEILIASGVRYFLFFGSCGSLSPVLEIGDFLLPHGGISDEGTSQSYMPHIHPPNSSPVILNALKNVLRDNAFPYQSGLVWTTDSPFRETPEKIKDYINKGAVAVEMEFTGLATAAKFFEVDFCAMLIVSDECFHEEWKKGFYNHKFLRRSREGIKLMKEFAKDKKWIKNKE